MKYFFALAFLWISPLFAFSPAVRVDLSACQLQGSANFAGTLVEIQGQHYVVTSSWAQMSSKLQGPRCEKVFSENGELAVRPVVTDPTAGLALYQVTSAMPAVTSPVGDDHSSQVWVLGSAPLSFSGDIVIAASKRHHIPAWDRVIEWQGDLLSTGAIGAGVWSHGHWQGIVSHEYLELIPGAKTKTSRWNLAKQTQQDHVIVIKASDVTAWMQKQVAQPREPVVWLPEDQRAGKDRWIVGDLEITALCPDESNPNPGGEYPIGGNDGFGIGGDSVQNKACKVQVKRATTTSSWMPLSLQNWEAQTQSTLAAGHEAILWYGLGRSQQGIVRDYIFSAESLIQSALDNNKKWVDEIPASQPPTNLVPLIGAAQSLQALSMHCYEQLYIREQNVQELVRRLYFFATIAKSQAWHELQPRDVTATMDEKGTYAQGWRILLFPAACDADKLRATAETFMQEHQKVWTP